MLYEVVLRLVFTEFLVQVTRGTQVTRHVSQLLSVRELWSLSGDPATSLKRTCVQKLSSILMLLTFMSVLPLALVTTSLRLLVHFPNLLCERGRGWQAVLSNS